MFNQIQDFLSYSKQSWKSARSIAISDHKTLWHCFVLYVRGNDKKRNENDGRLTDELCESY